MKNSGNQVWRDGLYMWQSWEDSKRSGQMAEDSYGFMPIQGHKVSESVECKVCQHYKNYLFDFAFDLFYNKGTT